MTQSLKTIIILTAFFIITFSSFAQNRSGQNKSGQGQMEGGSLPEIGMISGLVIDSLSNEPIEYATIALYSQRSNELTLGTISQKNGKFFLEKIKPGPYFIKISFLGYEDLLIPNIKINREQTTINLHKIKLKPSLQNLEEVVVDGSAPRIDYKIDKKVINVSKQITSISGTAVDVLENVPSVKVDIEGNVSLRGSTGFTVLIDGRPSILDANDILQQIPASTIDNIEIITNPSAKYDPAGTAGIINIITKKNKLQGISGVANGSVGLYGKYGGDFLVNYQKRKINLFLGADYNIRTRPGEMHNERQTTMGDTTYKTLIDGENERKGNPWGIRAGLDYKISDNDNFGLGVRYGQRKMSATNLTTYDESILPAGVYNKYSSIEESSRGGLFYELSANYLHKFTKKGHELKADINLSQRDGNENSKNELTNADGVIVEGKENIENGPSANFQGKIDYTLPLGEKGKFEAGYQAMFNQSEDQTELHILNTTTGIYENQEEFSHATTYTSKIHSVYALYAGEVGKFGYQGGLRSENTYRDIVSNGDTYGINRWDFFPTVHLSYQLPKENQLMASYTRRIERTRGWFLEPFITWVDAYNVRQGNPDLLPEFIDSYELSYMKKFGQKSMFSLEGYYRITNNKVEHISSVYEDNVMLGTVENVGKDYSLGLEFMFSTGLLKWWEVDVMGDLYHYKVEGVLYDEDFSNQSNTWSARFNNTFIIQKSTKMQLNAMYNGPSVTAQGKTEADYTINAAIRQEFFDNKLSAALQIRDIFGTSKREFSSSGPGFYTYSSMQPKTPDVNLTISYKFNNYKTERKSRSGGNGGEDGELEEM